MKDFTKRVAVSTCMLFTSFMIVSCGLAIAFTGPEYGLIMTFALLLCAFLFAALQTLWFTDKIIRRLSYPVRILGFGITAFIALTTCAWLGAWFPMENPWAWASFAMIYLVILAICCIGYHIYFKKTVGSFDAALRKYHENMGRQK